MGLVSSEPRSTNRVPDSRTKPNRRQENRIPGSFPTLFLAVLAVLLAADCGGEDEAQRTTPPSPGGTTASGSDTGGEAPAGDLEGEVFVLDESLPVPPRFESAYRRGVPMAVEFFQQGQDPYHPQGLEVDDMVNEDLTALHDEYPQVELLTYDIDAAGAGEDLEPGEYVSLAA